MFNQMTQIERINGQIAELEKMRNQMQQPAPITQNFQIAPSREVIRYANSLEEVQRDVVVGDTPYFSRDMSVVWIKNTKGEIKTYELNEIIPKDDKDIKIEFLEAQIKELREEMKNAKSNVINVNEPTKDEESSNVSDDKPSAKKSK